MVNGGVRDGGKLGEVLEVIVLILGFIVMDMGRYIWVLNKGLIWFDLCFGRIIDSWFE